MLLSSEYNDANIQMKEVNIPKSRKRKYGHNRCVKRPEIEYTEQSNDSSESISPLLVGKNIMTLRKV